jgi:hypothetical protein
MYENEKNEACLNCSWKVSMGIEENDERVNLAEIYLNTFVNSQCSPRTAII